MDIPKHLNPYVCINCEGSGDIEEELNGDLVHGPCVNCSGRGFIFEDIWDVIDEVCVSSYALFKVCSEVILPALKDSQMKRDMGELILNVDEALSVAAVARQKLQPNREKIDPSLD